MNPFRPKNSAVLFKQLARSYSYEYTLTETRKKGPKIPRFADLQNEYCNEELLCLKDVKSKYEILCNAETRSVFAMYSTENIFFQDIVHFLHANNV